MGRRESRGWVRILATPYPVWGFTKMEVHMNLGSALLTVAQMRQKILDSIKAGHTVFENFAKGKRTFVAELGDRHLAWQIQHKKARKLIVVTESQHNWDKLRYREGDDFILNPALCLRIFSKSFSKQYLDTVCRSAGFVPEEGEKAVLTGLREQLEVKNEQ